MFAPLTKPFQKRKIVTYDLEWIPGNNPKKARAMGFEPLELRLIGTFDGERYRSYTTIESFMNSELTKRNNGAWLFAHAGGTADLRFIFEWLIDTPHGYEVHAAFRGSSAVIVRVRRGSYTWTFVDSFFLMRQSLRDIGEWLGMSKGGEKDSTDIFYAPLPVVRDYNEQDNRVLYTAIRTFEETLNELGGELSPTVASCAMGLFRRRYLKRTLRPIARVNDMSRLSYSASRVEVFQQDVSEADYYDINSSFPFEMTFTAPGNVIAHNRTMPDHELFLAKVRVRVPDMYLPPLPYRTEDRRLYFPTGEWDAWLTGIDCQFLEECGGRIMNVEEVYHFDRFDDLAGYATDVYDKRKRSTNEAYRTILKFLLNSLYGKFAESAEKHQIVINPGKRFFQTKDLKSEIMPGVWEQVTIKEPPHTIVPISAHITARARRALTRYMRKAPEVYYCDTDGFAVPNTMSYPTGKELGQLKYEKPIWKARFEAPKLYTIQRYPIEQKPLIKAKGFSRIRTEDGDRRITYDDFCRLLEHRDLEIAHFERIREGLKKGHIAPRESPITKTYKGQQRPKRRYLRDGNSRPWTVKELSKAK